MTTAAEHPTTALIRRERERLNPSPVEPDKVPAWLRRLLLAAKRDGKFRDGRYSTDGRSLLHDAAGDCGFGWNLDHWGTTKKDGNTYFVSEPYSYQREAVEAFAAMLGLKWWEDSNSWWFPGRTVRLWFAPADGIFDTPRMPRRTARAPFVRGVREWRRMRRERVCPLCGLYVPEGAGLYCCGLGAVVHQGECARTTMALAKDSRRSRGGRFRTRAVWRRLVDAAHLGGEAAKSTES